MIHRVAFSKRLKKQLRKVPTRVNDKLLLWVGLVQRDGLEETRKVPGFHDEPLKGKRKEQRSVRLTRSYRAIYQVLEEGLVEFVEVQEVNKHEY